MVCHVAKFRGTTFCNPKLIDANKLNFKPILAPIVKSCKGHPIPVGCMLVILVSFSSACKNLGVQHP